MCELTNQLIHEFVNDGAHPDRVATDPDFRALIDHLINFGHDLKGRYKHMGEQKHVTIEKEKFDDLTGQASELIKEIRNWHVDRTRRIIRFIRSMAFCSSSFILEPFRFTASPLLLHLLWDLTPTCCSRHSRTV